ncbi:MAG TPA: dihydrodipicolinate synthase family protein [Rhizomicrobium sp.]|nr:dihydrodipicolinate synthase family protein [Rhizomicrobium sp.]
MKLDHTASGVYSIAPTPFLEGGAIDWNSVDRMTDFYFECGCNGFTVLGVLGEASKMDAEEALAVASRVIKRANGKQIIVGVSAPGFAAIRSLTAKVMDLGAAGVMIAPGAGLKTDDSIAAYFRNAVEAIGTDVPWVLQDYPQSTGVTMTAGVVRRVVTENPSLAVIKHEDWPGLDKITTLRGWERDGSMRPVSILVGNNGVFLDFELDRGVDGANTGYAFPDMLVETVKLSKAGKRDEAHDLFDAHLPLLRYDQQPGIGLAVRKYVLQRRGVLATAVMRKPAPAFTPETRADVDYLLARLARRDRRAMKMAAE